MAKPRRFEILLIRSTFNSDGVNWERHDAVASGKHLADGVVFKDGTAVVRWVGEHPSTVIWDGLGSLREVHHVPDYDDEKGYEKGERALFWLDEDELAGPGEGE